MDSHSDTSSPSNGNKLLSGLLVFFVLLIIFEAGYYWFFKKPKTLTTSYGPTPSVINPTWPDAQTTSDVPPSLEQSFNFSEFILLKEQAPKSEGEMLDGSIFKGKIVSVIPARDGETAAIKLESALNGSEGKLAWYVYPQSVVNKLSVRNAGDENTPLTLTDLKPGDSISIEEQFDLAKEYPEALVYVKIVR